MKRAVSLFLIILFLFSLSSCGSDIPSEDDSVKESAQDAADTQDEKDTGNDQPSIIKKSGLREKDFYGCWKYDSYPYYLIFFEDGSWYEADDDGIEQARGTFCIEGDSLLLKDPSGNRALSLVPSDGKLKDSDGDMLTASVLPGEKVLPSKYDPLTETISFSDAPITLSYPSTMRGAPHSSASRTLSFNAVYEEGTQDYWTNISVQLSSISGYDPYMTKGYDTAKHYMEHMLKALAATIYPNKVVSCEMNSFEDCGTYWKITGFAWLKNEVFSGYDGSDPILGVFDLRYIGPTGYALFTIATAISGRVDTYSALAEKIADSAQFNTGFRTAPKTRPSNSSRKSGSDSGDYGTPYYWYDDDGDVWYWNGKENVFIGYGNNYYIDDDGQYYESNNAGWDYEDLGDYYEANDYGWGEDYYNEWSDPGDTWDWDDYYEANDYGWGDDYYNEWSDPGDDW